MLVPDDQEALMTFLGEGFHTAFRKVGDSDEARIIYDAIEAMDPDEWDTILAFVVAPLIPYVNELES